MAKGLRLSGLDPVFFTFHLLFLGITYSIYLAPHIAPSTFPYFGLIPIFYPLLVLGNILLIVLLFFRRVLYALLFVVLAAGLYPPLSKTYQFYGKEVSAEPNFKMITFNGQYLREDGFEAFFRDENADLVVLQEVYWKGKKFEKMRDSVFQDYYHEKHSIIQFFSKYPIIETKKIISGENRTTGHAAYADIDTGKDTIRIINIYLESMLIDKDLVKETLDTERAEENSKKITNKLSRGFLEHEKQIQKIIPYIVGSKHPVILAGDLNSVPNSYEYQQFIYRLNDAYHAVGKSSGTTFHEFKYPLRLDYIFHSDEIMPVKVEVKSGRKLSDHYPVVGYFRLP
ncbi:MAG: endonuclease/exonuclease/phosphatase family protein [Moheibacter sp.]